MKPPLLKRSKLPDEQRAIAVRLGEERRSGKFSLSELATDAGVGRASIANYEYGLASLQFSAGVKLCRRLDLNQQWLATGREPRRPYVPLTDLQLDPDVEDLYSGTFLDGFRELLAAPMRKWVRDHPLDVLIEAQLRDGPAKAFARMSTLSLERFIREESAVLREQKYPEMKITVLSLIQGAVTELQRRLEREAARG